MTTNNVDLFTLFAVLVFWILSWAIIAVGPFRIREVVRDIVWWFARHIIK